MKLSPSYGGVGGVDDGVIVNVYVYVVFLVFIFPKGVDNISVGGVLVHWLHTHHYRSYL